MRPRKPKNIDSNGVYMGLQNVSICDKYGHVTIYATDVIPSDAKKLIKWLESYIKWFEFKELAKK